MKNEGRIRVFPKLVDNNFRGYKIAEVVFILITAITIIRSCIHMLAPDGGAGTIAGINTSVAGGPDIISIFALWGLSQLLMGFVYLTVFWRYKSLIPLMYILIILEYTGRIVIGHYKPLVVAHTPPGAIGDYIIVPIAIIMLILSLKKSGKSSNRDTDVNL
jgi:hypothetical protein